MSLSATSFRVQIKVLFGAFCFGLTGWKGWGQGPTCAQLSQEFWFWQLKYKQLEWSPVSLALLILTFSCLLCLQCQVSWLILWLKVCVSTWDEGESQITSHGVCSVSWTKQVSFRTIDPTQAFTQTPSRRACVKTKQKYYDLEHLQEETLPTHLIQVAIMTPV